MERLLEDHDMEIIDVLVEGFALPCSPATDGTKGLLCVTGLLEKGK